MRDALSSHTNTMSSTFQVQLRNSLRLNDKNRLTYTFGLSGATLPTSTTQPGGTVDLIVPKAIWEFRPKDGIELSVGREELPTGLGLPDPQAYMRKGTDPGNTVYPTQVKAFIYTHRLQLAPFVFGPGGDEDPRLQQYGVGTLAGVDVWKHRAIVGVSLSTRGRTRSIAAASAPTRGSGSGAGASWRSTSSPAARRPRPTR